VGRHAGLHGVDRQTARVSAGARRASRAFLPTQRSSPFLIPAAILVPFKLLAFWLIARGHGLLGLEVFVVAKIVGTGVSLARIFAPHQDDAAQHRLVRRASMPRSPPLARSPLRRT